MKIEEIRQGGSVLLKASALQHVPERSDAYCVCIDAHGCEDNGDQVTYRLTLTKNEIAYLQRLAVKAA